MDDDEQIYDLRAAWEAIRRRWLLVVAITILVGGAAALATLARGDRFSTTAVLLFRDPGLDPQIVGRPNLLGGEQIFDADTNVGLASLDVVADRVGQRQPELSAAEVSDAVDVREGAGPELVEITAEVDDAASAEAIANAYAEAFIDLRRAEDRANVHRAVEEAQAELAELPGARAEGPEGDELRARIGALRSLELLQTGDAELVERADLPAASDTPVLRNAVAGGIAGLLLGLTAALLVERLGGRLRSAQDLRRAYRVPVLASLPAAGGPEAGEPETASRVDGIRRLAAQLRLDAPAERALRVLVLPQAAGSGASAVALELARTSAADGVSTLLVEADLATPSLADRTGLERGPGLREVLGSGERARAALQTAPSGEGELEVLTAGEPTGAGAALLGGAELTELLKELGADRQLLVIDAPPLAQSPDAIPLCSRADAVVVVVDCARGRTADARELRRQLDELGAPLLGVVANRSGSD